MMDGSAFFDLACENSKESDATEKSQDIQESFRKIFSFDGGMMRYTETIRWFLPRRFGK